MSVGLDLSGILVGILVFLRGRNWFCKVIRVVVS